MFPYSHVIQCVSHLECYGWTMETIFSNEVEISILAMLHGLH